MPKTIKRKTKKPSAGTTKPSQLRLTEADLATARRLGTRWGPVKALTRTDVVREALRRAYVAEFGAEP